MINLTEKSHKQWCNNCWCYIVLHMFPALGTLLLIMQLMLVQQLIVQFLLSTVLQLVHFLHLFILVIPVQHLLEKLLLALIIVVILCS